MLQSAKMGLPEESAKLAACAMFSVAIRSLVISGIPQACTSRCAIRIESWGRPEKLVSAVRISKERRYIA